MITGKIDFKNLQCLIKEAKINFSCYQLNLKLYNYNLLSNGLEHATWVLRNFALA